MKLLKFRIENYKSIVDSGDCFFSDKLTILAGKNEGGKTTILEALEDFHEDKEIREDAQPIDNPSSTPKVTVTFSLAADEINEVYKEAKLERKVSKGLDLGLLKQRGSKSYSLTTEARKSLDLDSLFLNAYSKTKELSTTATKPKYASQALKAYNEELKEFRTTLAAESEDIKKVDAVIEAITLYLGREVETKKFIDVFVANTLPYFILFSSFEDRFPDEIAVADLATSEWASDLEEVSSFNRKTIAAANRQMQNKHQRTVNTEFSDKFNRFWTQDAIRLEVVKDGDTVCFWIIEDDIPYKPSQRSQGQQWYLSFLSKLSLVLAITNRTLF